MPENMSRSRKDKKSSRSGINSREGRGYGIWEGLWCMKVRRLWQREIHTRVLKHAVGLILVIIPRHCVIVEDTILLVLGAGWLVCVVVVMRLLWVSVLEVDEHG